RESAAGARPPSGQSSALSALLVITLTNLAFGCEPVFRFVPGFESAALGQQVGQAADFLFYVNRHKISANFVLHDRRLHRGLLDLCRRCLGCDGAGLDLRDGRRYDFRTWNRSSWNGGGAVLLLWSSGFCHMCVLLANS